MVGRCLVFIIILATLRYVAQISILIRSRASVRPAVDVGGGDAADAADDDEGAACPNVETQSCEFFGMMACRGKGNRNRTQRGNGGEVDRTEVRVHLRPTGECPVHYGRHLPRCPYGHPFLGPFPAVCDAFSPLVG